MTPAEMQSLVALANASLRELIDDGEFKTCGRTYVFIVHDDMRAPLASALLGLGKHRHPRPKSMRARRRQRALRNRLRRTVHG